MGLTGRLYVSLWDHDAWGGGWPKRCDSGSRSNWARRSMYNKKTNFFFFKCPRPSASAEYIKPLPDMLWRSCRVTMVKYITLLYPNLDHVLFDRNSSKCYNCTMLVHLGIIMGSSFIVTGRTWYDQSCFTVILADLNITIEWSYQATISHFDHCVDNDHARMWHYYWALQASHWTIENVCVHFATWIYSICIPYLLKKAFYECDLLDHILHKLFIKRAMKVAIKWEKQLCKLLFIWPNRKLEYLHILERTRLREVITV